MGLFDKIFRRSRPAGPLDDYWYFPFGAQQATSAGVRVSEETAIKYLTIYACVSLIAGDVARLPLNLYRKRRDGGKDTVTDQVIYDLLHNAPNDEINSFNWREAGIGQNLLWGNHYSLVRRNDRNRVVEIWPLDNPGNVEVYRNGAGELRYRWDAGGRTVDRGRDEIFHVPGFGFNGLKGMSQISVAREAVGLGLGVEQFGARYFGEGTHPTGVVQFPQGVKLGEKAGQYHAALKEQWAGLGKAHSLMVLSNGEEFKPLTIPLEDAQFLETRNFQKIEICGMYHVPPHKIAIHGANSNYNNLEQENQHYIDACLIHWVRRWECCINQQLLTRAERLAGFFFEFNLAGLLRGDSQARADFYTKLWQVGAITQDEIRGKENMNPLPAGEGDKTYVPLNFIPADQAAQIAKEPAPQPGEEGRSVERRDGKSARETRSILVRDRIAKQYHPLIRSAAEAVVNREAKAVKAQVTKMTAGRAFRSMDEWLGEFYRDFPEYIRQKMGPVLRSFCEAIRDAAGDEVGIDPDRAEVRKLIDDFVARYAERHIESSEGQLRALLAGAIADLEQRVDEWRETRPEKIARNETTRASNAVYQAVVFAAGLGTVWRVRGAETCPYCKELNGKRIVRGQSYVENGQEITPEGKDAMPINGTKAHPPLHRGCDCYLTAG
ncbi:phage portal protein [Desulfuromonas thiophila]|uniref:Phage portal protein, HK97 family n=1 Tax=Desulfuromonas thiophila TaxID=57664 RepID=A0A1G7B2D7_9BACT|nr:phage portal protein [Desulfuromonas thiophila]SDE21080.1 phage portal protein, HK97 family [Desulfuromonas thiophila]